MKVSEYIATSLELLKDAEQIKGDYILQIEANTASIVVIEEKLDTVEEGAEVNNISDSNATDLTDGNDSTLHYHSSDRSMDNAVETATKKVLTSDERAAIIANTAKISYTDSAVVTSHTADINAVRELPVTALSSTTYAINAGGLRAYQTKITSATSTAKTITVGNVSGTSGIVEIGIVIVVTTGFTPTFTDTTFVDGAPTLETGTTWAIALTSFNGGLSYLGKYTQLA